jgi:hypothetical protein
MPTTAQKIAATFADGFAHDDIGILFPKSEMIEKTEIEVKE